MTTSSYTTITRSNSVPDIHHNHLLNIVSNTPSPPPLPTTTTTIATTIKSQQQQSSLSNLLSPSTETTTTTNTSAMITPPLTALLTTTTTSLQTNPLSNSFSNSRDCISNATDDEDDDDESNESSIIDLATKTIRRHSSQSLILNTNTNNGNNNNNNTTERVCSSPINALKMSTRVCQIKIDEGIEPHLSREIKSEREMQNTLKLKCSYDELVLDKLPDDQQISSSSSSSSSKFRRYRTCSDSLHNTTLPSPSQLSPSYSNSTSPTNCMGLLRCNSPFAAGVQQQLSNNPNSTITPNYFSPCPSPTAKLFGTSTSRRSMSPINKLNSQPVKRKFSDVDVDSTPSQISYSPKRFLSSDNSSNESNNHSSLTNNKITNNNNNNNNSSNQFAYPLVINTSLTSNISNTSTINSNNNSNNNNNNNSSIIANTSIINSNNTNKFQYPSPLNDINKLSNENNNSNSNSSTSSINSNNNSNGANNTNNNNNNNNNNNKYTFMPIQVPQSQLAQKLLRPNNINIITNSINSSPIDSPARCCDSPSSYSSVSLMSASEKPDSGYQSSVQNNSDSESCI